MGNVYNRILNNLLTDKTSTLLTQVLKGKPNGRGFKWQVQYPQFLSAISAGPRHGQLYNLIKKSDNPTLGSYASSIMAKYCHKLHSVLVTGPGETSNALCGNSLTLYVLET